MDEVLTPDSPRATGRVEGYDAAFAAGKNPPALRQAVPARLAGKCCAASTAAFGQESARATLPPEVIANSSQVSERLITDWTRAGFLDMGIGCLKPLFNNHGLCPVLSKKST